jgi:hypothetical protein
MKRIYIKPETTYLACESIEFLAKSADTEWHTGTDGQDTPVGPQQPDPNSDDAKQNSILFDDLWE